MIWVSSGGMYTRRLNVEDPEWTRRDFDGVAAYAEAKRAQVVLSEMWAERLRDRSVRVNAMHPGWADTPAVEKSLPRFHRLKVRSYRSLFMSTYSERASVGSATMLVARKPKPGA